MGRLTWSGEPFNVGDYVEIWCCEQVCEQDRKTFDGRRGTVTKTITYRRGEYGIPLVEVRLEDNDDLEVFEDVDLVKLTLLDVLARL